MRDDNVPKMVEVPAEGEGSLREQGFTLFFENTRKPGNVELAPYREDGQHVVTQTFTMDHCTFDTVVEVLAAIWDCEPELNNLGFGDASATFPESNENAMREAGVGLKLGKSPQTMDEVSITALPDEDE